MLKKIFGFDPAVTTLRTEILAGITTFLTMSYILAVNPSMFSRLDGMPAGAVFTATALAAITGTLIMSLWAKLLRAWVSTPSLSSRYVWVWAIRGSSPLRPCSLKVSYS